MLLVMGLAPAWGQEEASGAGSAMLFDFENQADLAQWADMPQVDAKTQQAKEPAAKVEWTGEGATSGKGAMKIIFAGGEWPTVGTVVVPEVNWKAYKSLQADVVVGRACVVGLRVRSEKGVMDKVDFLQPGKNTVKAALAAAYGKTPPPAGGKVLGFDIYMYEPQAGESILVDKVCLSSEKADEPDYRFMVKPNSKHIMFKVLGMEGSFEGIADLANKMKSQWQPTPSRTLDQIEQDFKAQFEQIRQANPKAVLAVFRDGDKGFDPRNPNKVYDGWKDAYLNAHSPDGDLEAHSRKTGKAPYSEVFMRHRSRLIQVDLSSIPTGSKILASRFILTRAGQVPASQLATNPTADTITKPNLWVAEPCNRPWDEAEVNALQFAKGKFWKAYSGTYYGEEDPDFLSLFVAYGPSQGNVSWWDFTEAVKFWTSGKQPNHGFFWHGDSQDYWAGGSPTREAKDVRQRPALLVVYEPAEGGQTPSPEEVGQ